MTNNSHQEDTHRYDDIINLPHHVSAKHPQMSLLSRAAQFSPFAALTGFDGQIEETARRTEGEIELAEDGTGADFFLSSHINFISDL